jgi:hypothetical protein
MAKQLSKNKETMLLVRAAEKAGWTVTKCGSNHLKFVPPDPEGQVWVFCSTPSSKNDYKCNARRLRNQGVEI